MVRNKNVLSLSLFQTFNQALRLKPDAMSGTGSASSGSGLGVRADLTLASGVRQSLRGVAKLNDRFIGRT